MFVLIVRYSVRLGSSLVLNGRIEYTTVKEVYINNNNTPPPQIKPKYTNVINAKKFELNK